MGLYHGHPVLDHVLCGPVHFCFSFLATRDQKHKFVPAHHHYNYHLRHVPQSGHWNPPGRQLWCCRVAARECNN